MKHEILVNGESFATSENEAAIGKTYQTLLQGVVGYTDQGAHCVEIRKYKPDGSGYETVRVLRENYDVKVDQESGALPMQDHDEGCPHHGKDHVCNGELFTNDAVRVEGRFPDGKIPEGAIAQAISLAVDTPKPAHPAEKREKKPLPVPETKNCNECGMSLTNAIAKKRGTCYSCKKKIERDYVTDASPEDLSGVEGPTRDINED